MDEIKKKAAELADSGKKHLEQTGEKLRDAGEDLAKKAEEKAEKGFDEVKSRVQQSRQSRGDSE